MHGATIKIIDAQQRGAFVGDKNLSITLYCSLELFKTNSSCVEFRVISTNVLVPVINLWMVGWTYYLHEVFLRS
jgi:hypothetical protein